MTETLLVHATTVAIDGRAVLLRGPSGSGKSDLALRLIDAGARLVADDQSELWRDADAVLVRAPATIAGLIEVRGVGIVHLDPLPAAQLALTVDLVAPDAVERLPEQCSATFFGLPIPLVALAPFEASAVAKIRLALGAR
jgi:serine kinase of HPr protein (carbohydrate metabolism regulator)